ncbi:sugar ABC transporter permease [Marinobacter sp. BGYM27]|uniref:carbohydrate ABC transporter permease n=1 Tax=unclassified Marinobacter TaxID=83889 RepID=UPI000C61D897|nr:sugar ABC transporter permease [Marinobacter sp. BGYM27]MBH84287.1 ABC transporter permease [Alteromonadaceae bacterium]MDG5498521.1 sugar ABC transporter permease [Marinobacter sp. BGYM27]|tara:strand:+ start:14595 stop:15524 length:930 start_codon:yes stop_codon:yes gene_type:complete
MAQLGAVSQATPRRPRVRLTQLLERLLPKLALAPTVVLTLVGIYGFMIWTGALSLTSSTFLPSYEFAGFEQYQRLFANDRWMTACQNLAIFGALFIGFCLAIGCFLAILLDQRIRHEGMIRTIYLYPMALSMIVTGAVWQWILNPSLGLEKLMHDWGWTSFQFDWLTDTDMVIYTIVIAAVWQASGFVMALFLAGLRGIDGAIINAARVDGASLPRIYLRIVLPAMRPVFFSSVMVLAHIAIKSFDLVTAMTSGGPGYASDLPALFMYSFTFTRGQMGMGAASAMLMLGALLAILVPYLYSELRGARNA